MQEAELKRDVAMAGNWNILFVGIVGVLLIAAVMYFLTRLVPRDQSYLSPPAVEARPETGGASNGGAILITPNNGGHAPAVYFS